MSDALAKAVAETLQSPNESDRNGEVANVVDGLFAIARAIGSLAEAVTGNPHDDEPSLAGAISEVAAAIRAAHPFPMDLSVGKAITDAAETIGAPLSDIATALQETAE